MSGISIIEWDIDICILHHKIEIPFLQWVVCTTTHQSAMTSQYSRSNISSAPIRGQTDLRYRQKSGYYNDYRNREDEYLPAVRQSSQRHSDSHYNSCSAPSKPFCTHCSNLNRSASSGSALYPTDHWIRESRDPNSALTCPVLLATVCAFCRETGHTKSRCSAFPRIKPFGVFMPTDFVIRWFHCVS